MKAFLFNGTLRRVTIVAIALAVIATILGFVGASASTAATGTPTTGQCNESQWVREIPQSTMQNKYKKTVPAVQGVKEYKYKKEVKTYKTEYQYQKQVKGNYEKFKNGSWQLEGGTFQFEWWTSANGWSSAGAGSFQWSDSNVAVLQSGGHNDVSVTWTSNGFQYRKHSTNFQYVKNGMTRQIETGTTWEYSDWTTEVRGAPWIKVDERWNIQPQPAYDLFYLSGGGSSTTNTDANWTTDSPSAPWAKFDTRTVQGQAIVQGPVWSVNEPDRGQYPTVPWTKVPGTQVVCPTPPGPEPKTVSLTAKKRDKCESNNFYYVKKQEGAHATLNGKTVHEGVWLKTSRSKIVLKVVADDSSWVVKNKKIALTYSNNKSCGPNVPPPTGL